VHGDSDYQIFVRVWRPGKAPVAQLIILHGVVSHAEWLGPIAERLAAKGVEVICPDRRGTGLNNLNPGDAPSSDALLHDVRLISQHFRRDDVPSHLAGFCWGGSYAICFADKYRNLFQSLILIAPSVFPATDIAAKSITTGDSPVATETPLVPIDRFTRGPAYENYIVPDPLRTQFVSPRFNSIMVNMTTMLGPRWAGIRIPNLMILASEDSLADNDKHRRAFEIVRGKPKRLAVVPGEHGVQFDAPEETATIITDWLEMRISSHKK